MPGSSIWLAPPLASPLHTILSSLISKSLPARFPGTTGPTFTPHVTLTSGVSPSVYGENPQGWLESIPWPAAADVRVCFEAVKTEDVFFRRCYIKASFEGLRDVAGLARAHGVDGEETIGPATEAWLEEWRQSFGPHVSLLYGDILIDEETLAGIRTLVERSGVKLKTTGDVEAGGWTGGAVWLVPTDQPIEDWHPIATRAL